MRKLFYLFYKGNLYSVLLEYSNDFWQTSARICVKVCQSWKELCQEIERKRLKLEIFMKKTFLEPILWKTL